MDLRCESGKKFAVLDGYIEVKCNSPRCGSAPGVVVLHRFDPITGELVQTLRFRAPESADTQEGSKTNATEHHSVAVRSA